MDNLLISSSSTTPEVNFSPDKNIFLISGTSSPENVRAIYYPIIEWMQNLVARLINGELNYFSSNNPLKFQIDLTYFNSSSAKFLFDILNELKKLHLSGIPVIIEWCHEEEDIDMKDAGSDISSLLEMEFRYVSK